MAQCSATDVCRFYAHQGPPADAAYVLAKTDMMYSKKSLLLAKRKKGQGTLRMSLKHCVIGAAVRGAALNIGAGLRCDGCR